MSCTCILQFQGFEVVKTNTFAISKRINQLQIINNKRFSCQREKKQKKQQQLDLKSARVAKKQQKKSLTFSRIRSPQISPLFFRFDEEETVCFGVQAMYDLLTFQQQYTKWAAGQKLKVVNFKLKSLFQQPQKKLFCSRLKFLSSLYLCSIAICILGEKKKVQIELLCIDLPLLFSSTSCSLCWVTCIILAFGLALKSQYIPVNEHGESNQATNLSHAGFYFLHFPTHHYSGSCSIFIIFLFLFSF